MTSKKRFLIIAISVIILCVISYYLYEAYQYSKGIQEDIKRRDEFLDKKGVRLDSMGIINYEEFMQFEDSLDSAE